MMRKGKPQHMVPRTWSWVENRLAWSEARGTVWCPRHGKPCQVVLWLRHWVSLN